MKDETTRAEEAQARPQQTIVVRKQVPPYDQESPVEEPLFINHCQVARHGADAYIDVGVIPLEDILSPEKPGEVRFIVLNRLVMSIPTLTGLRDQITSLLEQSGGGNATTA